MLETGKNCWRVEQAGRASLIVDAANYFRVVRQAMISARSQILLIGWDFDTRIELLPKANDAAPTELGAFISWLARRRPDLDIHVLKWDVGAIKLLGRGTTVLRLARWVWHRNIHFKLDGAHPTGASHHQKIVVIDDKVAFCGGIDMTADRWDTREHLDHDERRRRPTTHRRYAPWHDSTMAVDDGAAKALGELARARWLAAGGEPIAAPECEGDPWPDQLEPMFEGVDVAISRTVGAFDGKPSIREIEALFVDQIRQAQRYIYAENQYFASRKIAKALAARLSGPESPEIILVNPRTGEGWLEEEAMSPARERLLNVLRQADTKGRFHIYCPVTAGGKDIYVHSKILVSDDRVLRVGSANMNNRSMGLDSECDLTIDASLNGNSPASQQIEAILCDLLAEHLGADSAAVAAQLCRTASLQSTIAAFSSGGRRLVPLPPKQLNSAERAVAENELLDPEGSDEDFEPLARPGLLKGLRVWRRGADQGR